MKMRPRPSRPLLVRVLDFDGDLVRKNQDFRVMYIGLFLKADVDGSYHVRLGARGLDNRFVEDQDARVDTRRDVLPKLDPVSGRRESALTLDTQAWRPGWHVIVNRRPIMTIGFLLRHSNPSMKNVNCLHYHVADTRNVDVSPHDA